MTTVFSQALDTNGTGAENYSMRIICRNMNGAGSSVTVTFLGSTAASFKVDNASIGIQNDKYNTVATPVELKFSGVSGFTLTAGSSITSDAATLTVAHGDTIIVIMDISSTNGNGIRTYTNSNDHWTRWVKTNTNSYNSAAPTGSWTNDGYCYGVTSIDIAGAVNDDILFTQTLTTDGTGGENNTYRIICATMAKSGNKVRAIFRGSSVAALKVDNASIGIRSSGGDTTATPTELLFGGGNHGFTANADQYVASDLMDFSYSAGDTVIVVYDISSTLGNGRSNSLLGSRYYKAATNSYNVQSISGLGFTNDAVASVVWQVQGRDVASGFQAAWATKHNQTIGAGVF